MKGFIRGNEEALDAAQKYFGGKTTYRRGIVHRANIVVSKLLHQVGRHERGESYGYDSKTGEFRYLGNLCLWCEL